jgi:two-component system, chemotaxis family, CheB/CheR fusion protein
MAESREAATSVDAVLEYLRQSCGADFSLSKRSDLTRQIARRRRQARIASLQGYLEYLDKYPDEVSRLLDALLDEVSHFFRDPEMWELLGRKIIPAIVAGKDDNEPIRVWSPGCASGEEVFTLAIVLAESMGVEQFRRRVSIYATDVSDDGLAKARQAIYDAKMLEPVGAALRSRYFAGADNRYRLRRDIRGSIVFGRHDLAHDVPISRLDLLICRNRLVYLDRQTQARVLARFHYALNPRGFLLLGSVDTLLDPAHFFEPVDLALRVFRKKVSGHDAQALGPDALNAEHRGDSTVQLEQEAFTAMSVAQIVVDADGTLALANRLARTMFDLDGKDLGQPFRDLEVSFQPVELRSLIDRARIQGVEVVRRGVERALPLEGTQYLDVQVRPLHDPHGVFLGAVISFDDTTEARQAQSELRHASEELQTAHEELQSANEELETTNEELRATVEELEATNEELHAINEEHEAMNEELQSTNKELRCMNEQVHDRDEELKHSTLLLEAILGNIGSGIVVIDQELNILVWSKKMQDLWGLRADEVQGRSLAKLDIGLPVTDLLDPLRDCLAGSPGGRDLVVTAMERRGRTLRCRVSMTALPAEGEVRAVVIRIDDQPS